MMFEDSRKTARQGFERWEDVRGLLYHIYDYLGGRICSRRPTRLVPVQSALVDGAIRGFRTLVLSGGGSGNISGDGFVCIAW